MGNSNGSFSKEELAEYQELTYLTKREIVEVYKRFSKIDPNALKEDERNPKIAWEKVLAIPELRMNPFKDRIVRVFSSEPGRMSFEDFLDMMSVFSEAADKATKVKYAFLIYDYDGDLHIGEADLRSIIRALTDNEEAGPQQQPPQQQQLTDEDIEKLVNNILAESDRDEDRKLSFAEFEHVISKAPDFVSSFRIRV